MDNPTWNDREQDPLVGSPELFVSNLVLVRAIENGLTKIEITREEDGITVQNEKDGEGYDRETLTDDPNKWKDIVERFKSMTESGDEGEKYLKPKTPATGKVDTIRIEYSDSETIVLTLTYP
ncbi:MAG: hypothetical protein ABEK50_00810 [bacterium]